MSFAEEVAGNGLDAHESEVVFWVLVKEFNSSYQTRNVYQIVVFGM